MLLQSRPNAQSTPKSLTMQGLQKQKEGNQVAKKTDYGQSHGSFSSRLEMTLEAVRNQYKLLMHELKTEHGIDQLEKISDGELKRSTINNVIQSGAVPDMRFVITIAHVTGRNFHALNARLTGIPLPGAPEGQPDPARVLRNTVDFRHEIEKLPHDHKLKLMMIMLESISKKSGVDLSEDTEDERLT